MRSTTLAHSNVCVFELASHCKLCTWKSSGVDRGKRVERLTWSSEMTMLITNAVQGRFMAYFMRNGTRGVVFGSAVLTCLLVFALPDARAAIPGADDPKAYTNHDLLRARVDFNNR